MLCDAGGTTGQSVEHAEVRAPLLAEDTDYVLGEILGYSPDKIAELRDTGIIG